MATTGVIPNGDKIRELRKDKGWSQVQLAEMAGVTQPRISTIEAGVVTRLSTVKHLALIFGLGPRKYTDLIAPPAAPVAPAVTGAAA